MAPECSLSTYGAESPGPEAAREGSNWGDPSSAVAKVSRLCVAMYLREFHEPHDRLRYCHSVRCRDRGYARLLSE
jgi:hypothetical protein